MKSPTLTGVGIEGILAPAKLARGDASWTNRLYTCTYRLPQNGRLVLSVKDSQDVESGSTYFDRSRRDLPHTKPLQGLISLGLPSYEAQQGIVAFLKDGKTLTVDASRLSPEVGGHQSREDVAYAVAAEVVACWSE